MLSPSALQQHNFSILDIAIPSSAACFGPALPSLLARTYSYDVIIINWAIAAFGKGFMYKPLTRELFNLHFAGDFTAKRGISMQQQSVRLAPRPGYYRHLPLTLLTEILTKAQTLYTAHILPLYRLVPDWAFDLLELAQTVCSLAISGVTSAEWFPAQFNQYLAFRAGVVFSTSFLFFVTTTLVSYTLRETQERMIRFTYQLQWHITHRRPYMPLIFSHGVESLVFVPIMVGIHFFLVEFFSDQLLAFLILTMVWMGEVFSILSLRSRASIRYFPKLFCGYFYLFHIYFFSFPFGFAYLAW